MPAGRPKGSKNSKSRVGTPSQRKMCSMCSSEKGDLPVNRFYRSYSKIHGDGYLPICKDCLQAMCFDEETLDIDIEEFKNVLRQMDKPYISTSMQSAINQYNDTYQGKRVPRNNRMKIIGYYFKNINSLHQYNTMNWEDGLEWERKMASPDGGVVKMSEESYELPPDSEDDHVYMLEESADFEVTQDIIRLFGPGYKKQEYKAMWDKYNFLKQSYPDVTNLHTEALVTYVRFKVQEEAATAKGNITEAEKWSNAAMKAADKAKINPSQLSQSDLQGGLNSFSELLQAVEQAVDVVPILPRFKYRPNDAIDFNIWCLVNYIRDLEGKPLCEYQDVYAFYDRRKAEYIAQYGDPYGIFADDPTERNRSTVEQFIELPPDVRDEPVAEVTDDGEE